MTAALRPAPQTALVLVVSLPAALEALRQRSIADAAAGVPAHVTLLYPFAEEAQLDDEVLAVVEAIASRHPVLRPTLGPVEQVVDAIDLITRRDGRWATRRRFPLGASD